MPSTIKIGTEREPPVAAAALRPVPVSDAGGLAFQTAQTSKPTTATAKTMVAPSAGSPSDLLQTQVRKLITAVRSHGERSLPVCPDKEDDPWVVEPERLLLDLEVDGVRCLLIKRASPVNPLCDGLRVCLSPREQEISRLIAQGYPNKAIADILEISTWTVGTHLRRIFAKFGVSSRAAMVACFLQRRSKDARVH